jgi:choline dehydrogenase
MEKRWDYIVVGAGSAGSVLAARLSEDPDVQVLLIEAGGSDRRAKVRIPGLMNGAIRSTELNWHYLGEPDPTLGGRRLTWAGGRVLGGSSSINGMVYGRGLPADYARWVAAGNAGWGWEDMLPWFRQMEDWSGPPDPTRGQGGPLSVRSFAGTDAACASAMRALEALGVPRVADYSVGITEGIGLTQATQRDGWRHSAAAAWLAPARGRRNLDVLTGALALQLIIVGESCFGVRVGRRGRSFDLLAARETIVAAGAIASPKLLLLSGIGDPLELEAQGIEPKLAVPGVGRNMNEHVNIKLSAFVDRPTYNTESKGLPALRHGLRFLATGSGPASSPANHCQAFVRTDRALPSADVQIQLMPFGFGTPEQMLRNGMTAVVSPCQPEVRGRVTLRSTNPEDPPCISIALLESARDRATLLRGCRLAHQALVDGPVREFGGSIYAPIAGTDTDAQWLDFFRDTAALNWHPTSTCRMGAGPDDVVDTGLRVHGMQALSVVDASIMPCVTSANTNVPVLAIAERAARIIAQRNR